MTNFTSVPNSKMLIGRINPGSGRFTGECQIYGCGKPVHEDVGIPLCDDHLWKAWAALEIRRADDPSLFPTAAAAKERDVYSPEAHGSVYFARVGELIKIGWTSNTGDRMSHLHADAVFHTQPGTRQDERALHAMFDHLLVKGREWFRSDPELVAYIKGLR